MARSDFNQPAFLYPPHLLIPLPWAVDTKALLSITQNAWVIKCDSDIVWERKNNFNNDFCLQTRLINKWVGSSFLLLIALSQVIITISSCDHQAEKWKLSKYGLITGQINERWSTIAEPIVYHLADHKMVPIAIPLCRLWQSKCFMMARNGLSATD